MPEVMDYGTVAAGALAAGDEICERDGMTFRVVSVERLGAARVRVVLDPVDGGMWMTNPGRLVKVFRRSALLYCPPAFGSFNPLPE